MPKTLTDKRLRSSFVPREAGKEEDKDLDRILRLYDIIKRYELLVEYLLSLGVYIPGEPLKDYTHRVRVGIANRVLDEHHGNVVAASKALDITRQTLTAYRLENENNERLT